VVTADDRSEDDDPRRSGLLASVDRRPAGDARESHSLDEVRRQLRTLRAPFDRSAGPVHVTASGIVVGTRGVLLHRHRRLHRWLQPGGHLEPGEWPQDAARRECEEETGLAVRHPESGPLLVHVDVHDAADGHVHLDLRYLLVGPDLDPAPPPVESQEVAWFPWVEAAALADDALAGALRSARRLIATGTVEVPGVTPEEIDG
jgi:8-oxo-dGTP pyrophosphatase MutT (NUDIX family)